jgi:hypothetical protein
MSKKSLFFGILVIGFSVYFFFTPSSQVGEESSTRIEEAKMNKKDKKTKKKVYSIAIKDQLPKADQPHQDATSDKKEAIEKKEFVPKNEEEASLHKINVKFVEVFNKREDPKELLTFFEEQNLAPEMMVDENKYTGSMLMIRTKNTLPGTRYYHAQYMGDTKENTALQHLSYEFRPGEKSLETQIQAVEATYPVSNKKVFRDGDFITYDLGEDGLYELSIEKTKWENLKDHPFNAYTKEDIGTIVTRIELKIHNEGSEEDNHIEGH